MTLTLTLTLTTAQTLAKTLRQKLNYYYNNILNDIEENQNDKEYIKDLTRKVQFKFKISERSIATGSIYVNSLYYYFNDLYEIAISDNFDKTNICKINTYLNLFEVYQSVFYTPEILNDEALAEHWWKNHFINILEQIALKSGFSLPVCLYSIRYATRTVISKATFNTTIKFFDNLKDKLKQKYCEKSIKYILIFIDIFKYNFKHSEFIVVENEANVIKVQHELNEKIDFSKIKPVKLNLDDEIDADVEVENLEIDDF